MINLTDNDVYFTQFEIEGEEYFPIARAIVYVIDTKHPLPLKKDGFTGIGSRRSVSVHISASLPIKRQALEFSRAHLLDTFDTDNALKVANFKGNEADLEAIQFPGTYTLEQVLAGDIPKDGIKLKETKEV